MKHFNLRLLPFIAGCALCIGLTGTTLSAKADRADWQQKATQLINQPLSVSWNNNGVQSRINLTEINDGFLYFNVPGQTGEASMPLNSLGEIWFNHEITPEYTRALGELDKDTFNFRHLEFLRQAAYPMVRFLEIPQQNSGFINVVSKFIEGLIKLGELDEAAALISQLDIDKLGPEFEEKAIKLAQAFVDKESNDKAIEIIKEVSIERIDLSNTNLILGLAHSLRDQEKFADARNLYQRLSKNEAIESREPEYWSYYCELQLGQLIDNHTFATDLDLIEPGQPNFPLQQLVLGIYYSSREQGKEAMRAISQGIAYATPIEVWTPELMFRSAKAYEVVEMPDISKSVYEETLRFFPNSKWAASAQNELNK